MKKLVCLLLILMMLVSTACGDVTTVKTDDTKETLMDGAENVGSSILGEWISAPTYTGSFLDVSEQTIWFYEDGSFEIRDLADEILQQGSYRSSGDELSINMGDDELAAIITNYRGFVEIYGQGNDLHLIRAENSQKHLCEVAEDFSLEGVWTEEENSIEFFSDGTFHLSYDSVILDGTYSFALSYYDAYYEGSPIIMSKNVKLSPEANDYGISGVTLYVCEGGEGYYLMWYNDPLGDLGPFNGEFYRS